jgi:PPIC-type PPIASE domain
MRTVLMCAVVLICAESALAQGAPQAPPVQNPAGNLSQYRMPRRGARRPGKPTRSTPELPPNTPVLTLDGVCDRPHKVSPASDCKTVITRAEMDSLINTLEPDAPSTANRQFSINYARLLAASDLAEQRHLDSNPEVAKELQVQVKLARMEVLADSLLREIRQQTEAIPEPEIRKYYAEHQNYFEQVELERVYLPKSAPDNGQPAGNDPVQAKAEELQTRAAAGEDFDQLQQEAYKDLGIKGTLPPTKLGFLPLTKFSADDAKLVFEMQPGGVTPLLNSEGAILILKLDSKKTISMEDARSEIETLLMHDRLDQELREATKSVKAQFNLKYLEMQTAPELFPPSILAPGSMKRGIVPNQHP